MLVAAATAGSCSDNNLTSPTSPAQLDGTWRLFQMTSIAGVHNEDLDRRPLQRDHHRRDDAGQGRLQQLLGSGEPVGFHPHRRCPDVHAGGVRERADRRAIQRPCCPARLTVRINARLLQLNDAQGGELRFEK